MLFVGRPLTLLALAVCTYVVLTWRYKSPGATSSPPAAHYDYDANGFRKYDPLKEQKTRPDAVLASPVEDGRAKRPTVLSATATQKPQTTTYTASEDLPLPTLDPIDMQEYMKDVLHWNRPGHVDGHFPDYEKFEETDFDPNRWEGFELCVSSFEISGGCTDVDGNRDKNFYESGVGKFSPAQISAMQAYLPYPKYQSEEWKQRWQGEFNTCDGPRGGPLKDDMMDSVRVYPVTPRKFPEAFTGSAEAIGMDNNVCVDRVQRYGPYGYNPLSRVPISLVDWASVKWGELQAQCFKKNRDRFAPHARVEWKTAPDFEKPEGPWIASDFHDEIRRKETKQQEMAVEVPQYRSRTAVLIRTWEGYKYTSNDILAIRSMVSELSLRTGGEYQVFLFVNVKNHDEPIFTDRHAYRRMLIKNVPRELRDIAILWNEKVCKAMYPDITDWQVYWHQFMSVQWFSKQHPEFDYVWNWEMDVRFIGNHFHFLNSIGDFSAEQPRKYLWERNSRFYIPAFHGKNYTTFVKDTHAIVANASRAKEIPEPVWGPMPYSDKQKPLGPSPPHSMEEDNYTWGVGEEADLITLLPIWDPTNTSWTMRNKIWNFTPGVHPIFNDEHPTDDEFFDKNEKSIPRRAFINTVLRLSKKLLDAMHEENLAGRTMQAEMWPTTVALHHGLKAVYAPHPIYSAVKWPARYADAVFNADGGVTGRWGQGNDSIYNQDREVNFRPFSWYYHARFPRVLYRRWMGWKAEDGLGEVGGKEWEEREKGGRMCLPQMLLHPVKREDLEDS